MLLLLILFSLLYLRVPIAIGLEAHGVGIRVSIHFEDYIVGNCRVLVTKLLTTLYSIKTNNEVKIR